MAEGLRRQEDMMSLDLEPVAGPRTVMVSFLVSEGEAAQIEQRRGEQSRSSFLHDRVFGATMQTSQGEAMAARLAEWVVACPACGARRAQACRELLRSGPVGPDGWHEERRTLVPEDQREAVVAATTARLARGGGR